MTKPNHYHLRGDGIAVTYYPEGSGPVTSDGRTVLTYQRANESRDFSSNQVTQSAVGSIGTIVTAEVSAIANFSTLHFSLLVPDVDLDDEVSTRETHISALGITTTLSKLAEAPNHFEVAHLKGVADIVEIALTS